MEQYDVYLCFSWILKLIYLTIFLSEMWTLNNVEEPGPTTRRRTSATGSTPVLHVYWMHTYIVLPGRFYVKNRQTGNHMGGYHLWTNGWILSIYCAQPCFFFKSDLGGYHWGSFIIWFRGVIIMIITPNWSISMNWYCLRQNTVWVRTATHWSEQKSSTLDTSGQPAYWSRRAYPVYWTGLIWISLWDAIIKLKFFVRFKGDRSLTYLQYDPYVHQMLTNEICAFRLICFFGFTVDNGGSQKTERINNISRIHSHKRGVLKYY